MFFPDAMLPCYEDVEAYVACDRYCSLTIGNVGPSILIGEAQSFWNSFVNESVEFNIVIPISASKG